MTPPLKFEANSSAPLQALAFPLHTWCRKLRFSALGGKKVLI